MISKKHITKKGIIIKTAIIITLFILMIISFFFADKIEYGLGLKVDYYPNQASGEAIDNLSYSVNYLDVGQGNCSVVELPDGKIMIIDGGSVNNSEKICEYLFDIGVSTIDYMIATHADEDHIGGLVSVLENFEVKNIYRPFQICGTGTSFNNFVVDNNEDLAEVYDELIGKYGKNSKVSRITSQTYSLFISKIYSETFNNDDGEQLSSVTVFYDGLKIVGDGYCLEFFMPLVREDVINLKDYSNTNGYATIGYGADDSNGNSAIFLLTIDDSKFLFTGDAPFCDSTNSDANFSELDFVNSLTKTEMENIKNVTVYLVGHHGSKYSSSEDLLKIIQPKFSVISVDKDNSYGFPRYEVVERLNKYKSLSDVILMTSEVGNISFSCVEGKDVYFLEKTIRTEYLVISWYVLSVVLFVFISYAIYSLRICEEDKKKR